MKSLNLLLHPFLNSLEFPTLEFKLNNQTGGHGDETAEGITASAR